MDIVKFGVLATFTEQALGTTPYDEDIAKTYVIGKNPAGPQADELAAGNWNPDEVLEKASTGFPRNPVTGQPIIFDYQLKGMFKDATGMLNRSKSKEQQMKAYKKVIDGLIFPEPRMMDIEMNGEMEWCIRSIRVDTPQGPRVAIARSEAVPAGSTFKFDVVLLDPKLKKHVLELLDYGKYRGLLQWRNSGKGRFTYELTDA